MAKLPKMDTASLNFEQLLEKAKDSLSEENYQEKQLRCCEVDQMRSRLLKLKSHPLLQDDYIPAELTAISEGEQNLSAMINKPLN